MGCHRVRLSKTKALIEKLSGIDQWGFQGYFDVLLCFDFGGPCLLCTTLKPILTISVRF